MVAARATGIQTPQPKPGFPQLPGPGELLVLELVKKLEICFSPDFPQTGQGAFWRSAIERNSSNFFPQDSQR